MRQTNKEKIDIKRFFRNIPITLRITLWYTVFVLILTGVMLTVSFIIAGKMSGNLSQKELIRAVNEIVAEPDEFESFDDGVFFMKYGNDGSEIEGNLPAGFDRSLELKENNIGTFENSIGRYYYYDMTLSEGSWIRGVTPVGKVAQGVNILLMTILILSPFLLLIIIYGGYKIIKSSLSPIEKISGTASEIQRNRDFSKRIAIDEGNDEVHKMANTFNEMLNSLENSYLHEKQFSSDVSHELRTPVSVILTESQYSLKYAENMEEAMDSFKVIERQAKRMSGLINQIMELSKIERQDKIELEKMDISMTVGKIIEDYRNILDEKNIEITSEIEGNLNIKGEKVMIERLLDNLLNNAVKFTRDAVKVRLYSRGEDCILEVEDNGKGIPAKEKENIWSRFYQINDSRNKEKNKGFGLGLSLVSKILELHSASAEIESEEGKGANFIVKFRKIC